MEAVSAETSRGAESSRMSQTTAVTRQGNRIFVEAAPLPSFRRRGDGQARVANEKFRHQRERGPKTWTSLRRCSMSWDTDCQSMYVRVRICYAGIEAIATGLPVIFLEPLKPGSVPQKKRATAAATLEEQKCKQCASCNNWERKDLDVGTWWTDGNKRGRSQKLSPVGQANNGTTALDRPVGKQNFQMF